MSDYLEKKANTLEVRHVFSSKNHFFEVINPKNKKMYTVSVKVNCDCEFMGIQGVANAEICSHVLAVLKKISHDNGIKKRSEKIITREEE